MSADVFQKDRSSIRNTRGQTIFFLNDTYAEKRLILNNNLKYNFVRLYGKGVKNQESKKLHDHEVNFDAIDNSCILHMFNTINMGTMKFLTSFETTLPWWAIYERVQEGRDSFIQKGLERISGENCIAICALSDDSRKKQLKFIQDKELTLKQLESIEEKCLTLYPPQKIIAKNRDRFYNPDKIKFIFVGRYFFLKGGLEILEVLTELRQKYQNFELTVVSALAIVPRWNALQITPEDAQKTVTILNESEWITWYDTLPNGEVLRLLNEHHVGLQPSYQETFGYAVLEEQAAGLPVVTTDIRAFPETNNPDIGYVINMPGRAEIVPGTDRVTVEAHKKILRLRLYSIFEDILSNPVQLIEKSKRSLQRVMTMHDPLAYAQKLDTLYRTHLH